MSQTGPKTSWTYKKHWRDMPAWDIEEAGGIDIGRGSMCSYLEVARHRLYMGGD